MAGLFAPLLMAAALVQTLAEPLGGASILALVSAVIGSGWLAVILLATSGKARSPKPSCCRWRRCRAPPSSLPPACRRRWRLLAMLPLVECVWVRRDRTGFVAGLAASLGSAPAAGASSARCSSSAPAAAGAWQWFVPAAYLATIAVRAATLRLPSASGQAAARRPANAEDLIDAVVLRLSRTGEVLDASAKAEPLLGLQPGLLLGSGLFDRVHVADRVAYLCALSDMREGAALRKLEIRLRAPRASAEESDEKYCAFRAGARRDRRCVPSR